MPDEPEIEPQCILCGEGEHRCDCQVCQCFGDDGPTVMWDGMVCDGCGGIVK